ncbi:MAG TPA: CBS domain-containing protein [Polyangiales bacterium]|jgi:acetoin utilization protein AcuB
MTKAPVSIQVDAELAAAVTLMQEHGIRHLPVLEGDRLVGVVSERDLGVIESLVPEDWERIVVAEAMTPSPFAVSAETPLAEVAKTMAERKYGCVVITGPGGALVGLFTTTDALRVLAGLAPRRTIGEVISEKRGRGAGT